MPLGIVNASQFKEELNIISTVQDLPKKGRGNVSAIPNSIRKLSASDAINGASNSEVSKAYGVSESSVSAYKNGDTSTSSYDEGKNTELSNHVNEERQKINSKALSRLVTALDSLTDEKLLSLKARDAASIAKDMSSVVRNLEPSNPDENNNKTPQVQVVIFSPQLKSEDQYEIIEVRE